MYRKCGWAEAYDYILATVPLCLIMYAGVLVINCTNQEYSQNTAYQPVIKCHSSLEFYCNRVVSLPDVVL